MTRKIGPEEAWQDQVVELARLTGWICAHFRPAASGQGFRTPVKYDGQGYPDLTMCRPGEFMVVECKSDVGRVSPDQQRWLDALACAGVEVHVWRPRDAAEVDARLTAPRKPPVLQAVAA